MNKTKTRTATIFMDSNYILHIIMHKDVRVDYEDAFDNALVIRNLTRGKKVLKLIQANGRFTIEKKAREFVNKLDLKQTIARAVVRNSVLSSLVVRFFTHLNKPKVPTKIFTDYDEAYKWLMEFNTNESSSL